MSAENKATATMHVLIGHTRGDELISSTVKLLFASKDRETIENKMAVIEKERDDWLAVNTVPGWAACSVFSRFEIVEVPDA